MRPQRSVGRGTGGATGNSFKLVMKSSSPLGWKEQRALPTSSSCVLPGPVQREEDVTFSLLRSCWNQHVSRVYLFIRLASEIEFSV